MEIRDRLTCQNGPATANSAQPPIARFEQLEPRLLLSGLVEFTELLSQTAAGSQGNDQSRTASISADGRFVAFESDATNLVVGDTNGYTDVFLYDRLSGELTQVSRPVIDEDPPAGGLHGMSLSPAISGDGKYVAFLSYSGTLQDYVTPDTVGDANGLPDIYVYEVTTGDLERLTNLGDTPEGILSGTSSISADGQHVAFIWQSMTPPPSGGINWPGVWVYDRNEGILSPAASTVDGNVPDGMSFTPSISGDGRYVAFWSAASNLVAGDTNALADVFVHDLQEGTTIRVSKAPDGSDADMGGSIAPSISSDGGYVAFQSWSTNLLDNPVSSEAHIYVYAMASGDVAIVSVSTSGDLADGECSYPSISSDGRYVAFVSQATNLVTGDTNEDVDIFVHDRVEGTTQRVSVNSAGSQADGDSEGPSINGDGTAIAFTSWADDLVAIDNNATSDVFLVVLEGQASDTPDLTASLQSYPSGIYNPGDNFASTIVLANDGRQDAAGGWDVTIALSIDLVRGNEDDIVLGAWTETDALPAGADRSVTKAFAIPTGAAMGRYYVVATIDSGNAVAEGGGEYNNNDWSSVGDVVIVPQGYVLPILSNVTSSRDPQDPHFQDPMRYIVGPGIPEVETTFTAEIVGSAGSVSFSVGGITVVDENGADGWQAAINMSEVSTPGPMVVVADGVSVAYEFPVNILMLPEWFQKDNIIYDVSFDEEKGYVFGMEVRDVIYGFFTPDDWVFTDPVFGLELINLANEWTGFWSASRFELISDLEGEVTPGPISYGLNIQVLGWTIYERFVEMSKSKQFGDSDEEGYGDADEQRDNAEASEGSFTGSLTGDIIYSFSDDLDWQEAAGRVSLSLNYNRDFDFFTMRFPIYSIGPISVLSVFVGGGLNIGMSLEASLTAQLDSESFLKITDIDISVEGSIAPKVFAGIEALYGLLGSVRISAAGVLRQRVDFEWDGDFGIDISAPGALDIQASLGGGFFCGALWWSKDWNWRVASWDFFANNGDDVDYSESNLGEHSQFTDVDLAADGFGNVLAVYGWDDPEDAGGNRHDLKFEFRDPFTGVWLGRDFVTNTPQVESSPAVAYTASGVPYLVYVQSETAFEDIDPDQAADFAAEQNLRIAWYDDATELWNTSSLVEDSNFNANPRIAFSPVSADGLVAWETGTPNANVVDPASMEIAFSEWNGATWSAGSNLTDNGYADWGSQVVYLPDGTPMVTWLFDQDGDHTVNPAAHSTMGIGYAVWDDGAGQWQQGHILPDGLSHNSYVKSVRMPDGAIETYWVTFEQHGRFSLYQAVFDGSQWSDPVAVLQDWMYIGEPEITVDADGRLAVLFTGVDNMQFGIYRVDHASPWSQPELISSQGFAASRIGAVAGTGGSVITCVIMDDVSSTADLDSPYEVAGEAGLTYLSLPPKMTYDDSVTLPEDGVADDISVLDNDQDAGAGLSIVDYSSPAHGQLTYNGDGTFDYTPEGNFNGLDIFTYTVSDGTFQETATVSLEVTPVNDQPVVQDGQETVVINTPIDISLNGQDVETDAADLAYEIIDQPEHGAISVVGNVATYTPTTGYIGPDSFTFTATDTGDPAGVGTSAALQSTEATVSLQVLDAVRATIGYEAAKQLVYTDEDGSLVTVAITGGQAEVYLTGDILPTAGDLIGDKKGIDLAAYSLEIDRIVLSGTTEKSRLSFKTKGGAIDGATVGEIIGSTPLKSLSGKTIDLVGDGIVMTGGGYIGSIQLHDIRNGADIVLPGTDATKGITIKAGQLYADTDIELGSYLKSLTATQWISGSLIAPWVSKIFIKGSRRNDIAGDFGASLELVGQDNRGYSLKSAEIAGSITGGTWDIDGKIYLLKAKNTAAGWQLDADGYVRTLDARGGLAGTISAERFRKISTKGELTADISAWGQNAKGIAIGALRAGSVGDVALNVLGGITSIKVTEWPDGSIVADWIGLLQTLGNRQAGIAGDFGADVTLIGQDGRGYSLKNAKIAGSITGGTWDIGGAIYLLKAKSTAAGWQLDAEGFVRTLDARGGLAGTISAERFRKISTKGELTADISAVGQNAKGVSINIFRAGTVGDVALNVLGGITSIKVTEWPAGSIVADWIGLLQTLGNRKDGIAGDFGASLELVGQDNRGYSLKNAKIAGSITGGTWDAKGAIGSIIAAQWDAGSLKAEWARNIIIKGKKADRNGDGYLRGDFGADVNLMGQNGRGMSLNKLQVAGTVLNSDVRAPGSMGSVILGAVQGSDFLAGIADTVDRHASLEADFVNPLAVIKLVKIKGLKVPEGEIAPRFFENSNFSAARFGTVNLLKNIDYDNDDEAFGFFALDQGTGKEIRLMKARDTVTGEKWRWPQVPEGDEIDFVVRVI